HCWKPGTISQVCGIGLASALPLIGPAETPNWLRPITPVSGSLTGTKGAKLNGVLLTEKKESAKVEASVRLEGSPTRPALGLPRDAAGSLTWALAKSFTSGGLVIDATSSSLAPSPLTGKPTM